LSAAPEPSSGDAAPTFDRPIATPFLRQRYRDDDPAALVLGFTEGIYIAPCGADRFNDILARAEREQKHLFFHVATLKPEWADPNTHECGHVTTASKDEPPLVKEARARGLLI
jgi:hypothetical protein